MATQTLYNLENGVNQFRFDLEEFLQQFSQTFIPYSLNTICDKLRLVANQHSVSVSTLINRMNL